jgi:hypothetical protein
MKQFLKILTTKWSFDLFDEDDMEDLDDDETRMIFHEDFDLMDELSAHQTHEFNEDDLTGDIDLGLHIFTMMNLDIIR